MDSTCTSLRRIDLQGAGRPAPTFAAETIDGDTVRLNNFRGEIVVINVWATWCLPCRVKMPGFVDLQVRYQDQAVELVGISVDRRGPKEVRAFIDEQEINFPQIVSPALAARHFPGTTVPRTYLIGARGRIRYEHRGVILKWALDDPLKALLDDPFPPPSSPSTGPGVNPVGRPSEYGQHVETH